MSIHPSIVPARLQIISAVSIYLNENPCIAAIANCSNSVAVPKAAPAANAFFHVVFFLINVIKTPNGTVIATFRISSAVIPSLKGTSTMQSVIFHPSSANIALIVGLNRIGKTVIDAAHIRYTVNAAPKTYFQILPFLTANAVNHIAADNINIIIKSIRFMSVKSVCHGDFSVPGVFPAIRNSRFPETSNIREQFLTFNSVSHCNPCRKQCIGNAYASVSVRISKPEGKLSAEFHCAAHDEQCVRHVYRSVLINVTRKAGGCADPVRKLHSLSVERS